MRNLSDRALLRLLYATVFMLALHVVALGYVLVQLVISLAN